MDQTTAAQAAHDRYEELRTYVRLYEELYGHRLDVHQLAADDETYQALIAMPLLAA
jgi:hypothetical protein